MKEYVVGFAFGRVPFKFSTHVLLIRKERPVNQRGLLNGVGGKIESRDKVKGYQWYWQRAMAREFQEETGLTTTPMDWERYAVVNTPMSRVHYLYSFPDSFSEARTQTDEPLSFVPVLDVGLDKMSMTDIRWLVNLALSHHNIEGAKPLYNITLE